MDKKTYRKALGDAAASLRTEHGHRSVASLAKASGLPESKIRRVEGSKEIEKGLTLATIEDYCRGIHISLGTLFTRADQLYARAEPLRTVDDNATSPTGSARSSSHDAT